MNVVSGPEDLVTVCIPVYRGEAVVAETLASLQRQTYSKFIALISVDPSEDRSVEACAPFLEDARFRLVEQEAHLGWVRNANWLRRRVETEYSFLLPHDDVLDARYIEKLLDCAHRNPEAAIVYCDIEAFGDIESHGIVQHSIRGAQFTRLLTYLVEHFNGVAWRGLVRLPALRAAGPMDRNAAGDYGAETVWLFKLLRHGEFVRFPESLYFKRYCEGSVHQRWMLPDLEGRVEAWYVHCVAMARVALASDIPSEWRSMIVDALLYRLARANPALGAFHKILTLPEADACHLRDRLLDRLAPMLNELGRAAPWKTCSDDDDDGEGAKPCRPVA